MSDRMYEFTVLEKYLDMEGEDVKPRLALSSAEDKYNRLRKAYYSLRDERDYYKKELRKLVPEEKGPKTWQENLRKREEARNDHKDLFD